MGSFSQDYYENYWQHRIKTRKVSTRRRPTRINVALEYLLRRPQTESVLDVGCGDGALGEALEGTDIQIDGTDISATSLKLAKKHYRHVFEADITNASQAKRIEGRYDAIVSLEIIEHLIDPSKLLDFVHEHLAPDGTYIVSFPNTAWWKYRLDLFFKGAFIAEEPAYSYLDHLHFFTLESLTNLLDKHGFIVDQVDGVFTLPWYFGRLPVSIQRNLGKLWPGLWGYQVLLICKKKRAKPLVAHMIKDFVSASEPWIYHQIISQKKFDSIVLCRNLKNQDHYPLERVFKYPLLFDGYQPTTVLGRWFKKGLSGLQQLGDTISSREKNYYDQIITSQKPALIHAHFGSNGWLMSSLARQHKIPLVISFYGSDVYQLPTRDPSWQEKYGQAFKIAAVCIAKGPRMKQALMDLGCPEEKISLVDHGIDISHIDYQPRTKGKRVKILSASRLIPVKGVDILIKAFAQIKPNYPEVELIIVGEGSEEHNLKDLARELKSPVTFKPFLPHHELLPFVDSCDIFVQSSVKRNNQQEGMPNSLLERMAAGMPVVATDHGEIALAVQDKHNGRLVPEGNVEALAEALRWLLDNPNLWTSLGKAARETIERDFEMKTQTRKRESLYQQFIEGPK